MDMTYPKTPEIRVLLLVKVEEGREIEAAQRLTPLVLKQQWRPDWSIKRVDVVDSKESPNLRKFAARETPFNLSIAVKASGHSISESHLILERAFREIAVTLHLQDPLGLILIGSLGADW